MPIIKFVPEHKEVEIESGSSILEAAAKAGIPVEGNCGGKGTCGKCKARLLSGGEDMPTAIEGRFLTTEQLTAGWILTCQRKPGTDTVVEVTGQKDAFARKTALKKKVPIEVIEPAVQKTFIELNRPSVEDQTPDLERLLKNLPGVEGSVDLQILSSLPVLLRKSAFQVTVVTVGIRLIAVEPGDTTERKFGLVFDIGTTTVVGLLLDLSNGTILAAAARTNPQNVFGADVISRINHAAKDPQSLREVQSKVIGAANEIITELLKETEVNGKEIYEVVVVGNTTMSHLFLGVDPAYLARSPFIPVFTNPVDVTAGELGLDLLATARVLMLPNIAGYVGSDTIGVMLATHLEQHPGIVLAIDIGTNGELVLSGGGRLLTCSTAAGPAFEGAQLKHGMRAADGAIEAVSIDEDVHLKVIGGTRPRGICGSGLIDAAAELVKAGIVSPKGRMTLPDDAKNLSPELKKRLRTGDNGPEFVLAWGSGKGEDIVITQKDIRELQLAKGAIYAGVKILLRELGASEEDITAVLLAGAFGNYIKKESALAMGLLPNVPLDRIITVGNAAGDGAVLALVSQQERRRAVELSKKVEHVELSARPDFQAEFLQALQFPERAG